MLRLENLVKIYKTADLEVKALRGLSISFRKNEFVSILGPSGCGKTTLLNIVGGLDQYSSGDLYIGGKSTKNFNDRDWDVYRNHRIGFVFQSYNLIPHQNILENVELSLTIAGLSRAEREAKAKAALDKVGLKDLYKKHPNQLSGGQCQRVAIARALVNEPDILLADEPTGALDSVTSISIMDLIKEISKEKLVIMVTHNPEIAEKYSTRIVNLKDGEIVGDSNPYSEEEEKAEEIPALGEKEKAKMSLATAFRLSGKNLLSKAKRTAMTVVAASIGIVGVSAVLAVSSGVTNYIVSMQDDMLSGNPITISSSAVDLTSLMNAVSTLNKTKIVTDSIKNGKVDVNFITESLVNLSSSLVTNEITEDYIRFVDAMPSDYYSTLARMYGIKMDNNVYTTDLVEDATGEKEITMSLSGLTSYADAILSKGADGKYAAYTSMISSLTNVVGQGLENKEYVMSQYDIVDEGGRFPEAENEMMLVLNHDKETTDIVLTMLGYYSQKQFKTIIDYYTAVKDKTIEQKPELKEAYEKLKTYPIEDIKKKTYTYLNNDDVFVKNYTDEEDTKFLTAPFKYNAYLPEVEASKKMEMKIVGILAPKSTVSYGCLNNGLYYTPAFTKRFIKDGLQSEIVSMMPTYIQKMKEKLAPSGYDKYVTGIISMSTMGMSTGIYYNLDFYFDGTPYSKTVFLGTEGMAGYVLTQRHVGGKELPSAFKIYPKSFKDKYQVTDYLDQWNTKDKTIHLPATEKYAAKDVKFEDRKEVKYSDNLEIVIRLVNNVIQIVTVALIAFTSLALLVSTVMIAIITYVSVIERIKEIGVIRALGGRKRDVSNLFNAETLIIGGIAGLFGIGVTYLMQLIGNIIVKSLTPVSAIAALPISTAGIVIIISVLLTMLAGIIPAMMAAKKDPVVALRTE